MIETANYNFKEFTGLWENGKPHGYCIVYSHLTNSTYVGDVVRGKYHGYGTLSYKSISKDIGDKNQICETYEGNFENNKYHGYGVLKNNGDIYEGNWEHGLKNAYGKITYANGSYYEGEWFNNVYHGLGTFTTFNNYINIGTWVLGKKTGAFTVVVDSEITVIKY